MDESLINSFLPFALIGLIALIIGASIGALLSWSLRGRGPDDEKAAPKDHSRVFGLWRDRKSGKLVVDLDGERFPEMAKLTTRQQIALQEILKELNTWAGLAEASSLGAAAAPPFVPPAAFLPGETPAGGTGAAPTASLPPLSYIPSSQPEPSTVKPPSMQLGDILSSAISSDPKLRDKEGEAPKSIATQIDEILQERLPASALQGRSVRLLDLPGRGLVVTVDGKSYEGVGDIPDEEVRKLIQECVAEWERTR